jgi:hypothetical protein
MSIAVARLFLHLIKLPPCPRLGRGHANPPIVDVHGDGAELQFPSWLRDDSIPSVKPPTRAELVALVPSLSSMLADAKRQHERFLGRRVCRIWLFYSQRRKMLGFRDRLHRLVGPDSGKTGVLGT